MSDHTVVSKLDRTVDPREVNEAGETFPFRIAAEKKTNTQIVFSAYDHVLHSLTALLIRCASIGWILK